MDRITKSRRSWNMSKIRSSDTKPEMKLRKFLYGRGYRYRIHYKITGKPDIAFPRQKIAIFIHGCFWHQHGCEISAIPKTNTAFWYNKLTENSKRDRKNIISLRRIGWHIKIVWECDLEKRFDQTTKKVLRYIGQFSSG